MDGRGRLRVIVVLFVVVVLALACSSCAGSSIEGSDRPTTPTATIDPTPTATTELPALAAPTEPIEIPGHANIFASGRSESSVQSGGGSLPPGWALPPGDRRVVAFAGITGGVAHLEGAPEAGPNGRDQGRTDVQSFDGISGIVHDENIMFLVGVFLTDSPPSDPAPQRLNVTKPPKGDVISPAIGQVFLVGEGTSFKYEVPDDATRLYVGFADACHPLNFVGPPGCYFNNSGLLTATLDDIETAA